MMNVVQSGSQYQIYGESLKTFKKLPVRSYDVSFHKMMGFFLTDRPDLEVREEKIYGNHLRKVQKVINSFNISNRNFGVILSGPKGIGKSLFARLLAQEGIKANLPVITVTDYIPGIANFLSSIEQEVIVIFDEFEKTFGKQEDKADPQEEMLSLFDGLDGGKKLFIVTCNDVHKLNSFMVDRPGRFHYHLRVGNPGEAEIQEYMEDKLQKEYWNTIPRIINFSRMIDMTYDYLRAISFDLNQGYSLEECFEDLNISGASYGRFDIYLTFEDGETFVAMNEGINLCANSSCYTWLRSTYGMNATTKRTNIQMFYNPADIIFKNGTLSLPVDKIEVCRDKDNDYDRKEEEIKALDQAHQARRVIKVTLEKSMSTSKAERFFV